MAEDPSALPWSINKDDYELQEVIGERRRGGTGQDGVRGARLPPGVCARRAGGCVGHPLGEGGVCLR